MATSLRDTIEGRRLLDISDDRDAIEKAKAIVWDTGVGGEARRSCTECRATHWPGVRSHRSTWHRSPSVAVLVESAVPVPITAFCHDCE